MSTALAVVEKITAIEFFKPGASKPILESVKKEARELAATFDVSTPAGEDGIRSLAAKLGKVKNKIENEGKALVADEKARLKVIDTERGVVWDEMESLQKEIRQPLTDKENTEKNRIATHEANLLELVSAGQEVAQNWQMLGIEEMRARLKTITDSEYEWQEFLPRAQSEGMRTITTIRDAIARREKLDAEAAELEQLRAAQAKREVEEREARIAQEAKDAADAVARKREEEQRVAAEAERLRIEDERIQADARAKQAEAERVAAEEKARKDAVEAEERHVSQLKAEQERTDRLREEAAQRLQAEHERSACEAEAAAKATAAREKAAAEKAEADAKAAVEAERQRAADEQRKAQEEAAKRESNRQHAAKINGEVALALMDSVEGLNNIQAGDVADAIAKGLIPHTKISY